MGELSNVLLAIDKAHTVQLRILDCETYLAELD